MPEAERKIKEKNGFMSPTSTLSSIEVTKTEIISKSYNNNEIH